MTRIRAVLMAAVCLGLLGVGSAGAQIFPEGALKVQFQLDFSNPGARSLGLAGAFLGRADDVTAAYANPAGLHSLKRPEVSLEGRRWNSDVVFRDTGVGARPAVKQESSNSGASFLAVAYPLKKFTLALYRHELATFSVSAGPSELFESASVGLDIVGVGLSAGVKVTKHLSIGASLVSYQSDLDARQLDEGGSATASGSDDSFGFNLGLMWAFNEAWSLGLVLREGPSFDVAIDREGAVLDTRQFSVPDVLGMGVSWQATHNLVASADFYFVQYSLTVEPERVEGGRFSVPDVNELRAGLEYTMWEYESSPAFRVGIWRDPAHNIRFQQRGSSPESDALARAFPAGEDETHFSAGTGFVFNRFQLDAAADFSSSADTYSMSIVVFF
jgi:long-chain fatty acid transport protein